MTTEQKIKNGLNGKQSFILNLNDSMSERIIANAHKEIRHMEGEKQTLMPAYKEKKEFYDLARKEFEEIKEQVDKWDNEIKQQQILIDTMALFRKNKTKEKVLQVNVPPIKREGTAAPKRIAWLKEAAEVLETELRFMTPHEIYDKIVAKPHIQEAFKLMKSSSNPAGIRRTTTDSIVEHAVKVAGRKLQSTNPIMTVYKDLIGLCEWVDDKNIPHPPMMKQFMYAENPSPKALPTSSSIAPLPPPKKATLVLQTRSRGLN